MELRRFAPGNAHKTFHWLGSEELRRLFLMASAPTPEGNLAYWRNALADPSQKIYAIFVNGEHIGNCGFKNIHAGNAEGELWMYLGDAAWRGKGQGTKALSLLLREGKRLGLRHILLHVAAFNQTARRLYARAGFVETAMPRDGADIWSNRGVEVLRMELSEERRRRTALMQPAFLPWQGYFALAAAVDVFVFLDDFQVSRGDFSQRNRLFSAPGRVDWLTVPVTHACGATFQEMEIQGGEKWVAKTLCRIQRNYARKPFFSAVMPMVEEWLSSTGGLKLGELDEAFVVAACREMKITSEFRHSSEFPCGERRSRRLKDLLLRIGSDAYHSAFGSFPYMRDDGVFPLTDIDTVFLDYRPQPYPQKGYDGFIPSLSVLDAFFNVGFENTRDLIVKGTHWLTWDERAERENNPPTEETENCPFTA